MRALVRVRAAGWLQPGVIAAPTVILLGEGWTHRWVAEDAFIDFRVVGNILAGHGPVTNVGERVEAFSNPLWVAILTVARGLVPFVSIEWSAVVLGLVGSALGVVMGTLATIRFERPRATGLVVPLGAVLLCAVDAVWQFETSGLETGLLFGWLGLGWWIAQRRELRPWQVMAASAVLGLGPEIRPDMFLLATGLLVAFLVADPARRWTHRRVAVVTSFLAPLALNEVFRVSYYGLIVPNTALVKSAFSLDLAQGRLYLRDFLGPDALWVPLALWVVLWTRWLIVRHRQGARTEIVMASAVVLAALADAVYVVLIGGDFMHARMLLPAFAMIALTASIDLGDRLVGRWALGIVAVWATVSLGFLRYGVSGIGVNGIANERGFYLTWSRQPHPVALSDYVPTSWYQGGAHDRAVAARVARTHGSAVLIDGALPTEHFRPSMIPAHSSLPERVFVAVPNIGIWGEEAGPHVYLFDEFSLANPIGSHMEHTTVRPGHSDFIPATWMLARFASASHAGALGFQRQPRVLEARRALACQPLSGYLAAITGPWRWSDVWRDVTHVWTWTMMRFPSSPAGAVRVLCHSTVPKSP